MGEVESRFSNRRARLEKQEAARNRQGDDLPNSLDLAASKAELLVRGDSEDAEPILQLVLEGLRSEASQTVGERRRIYDSIARGVELGVAQHGPNSEFAELRRRQLRAIMRLIEDDVRNGVDPSDPAYRPAGLKAVIQPLAAGYHRRRKLAKEAETTRARRAAVLAGEAFSVAVSPAEEGDLSYLRDVLVRIDAERVAQRGRHERPNLRAWAALLRYQFILIISESRMALVWMMVGPAILIGLISLFYFLSGIQWILNMPVPTFAVTGATTWLMFRNVIFRSCAAFHAHTWTLNFRPYAPWMVGMAVGIWIMFAYACVFCILIGGGYMLGVFVLPDDWLGVAFWYLCVGASGLALGVSFGALAVVWPYSPRLAPAIERFLEVFSSVALVSEQVPEDYRVLALWSPLAHALQMLRSCYFHSYDSIDARPAYFFAGLAVMIIGAVFAQRAVRSRAMPI